MTGFVEEKKNNLSDSSDEIFFVQNTRKKKTKLRSEEMIIDTVASKSIISEETLDNLLFDCEESVKNWIKQDREQTKNSFKFESGNTVLAEKIVPVPVTWKNVQMTLSKTENKQRTISNSEVAIPCKLRKLSVYLLLGKMFR